MKCKTYIGLVAAAALTGLAGVVQGSPLVLVDEFSIVKNGSTIFQDTFSNGLPPPDTGGNRQSYTVGGGPLGPESGGKLTLNAESGVAVTVPDADFMRLQRARVETNTDPAQPDRGLRIDDTFSVTGIFDLTLPTRARERYGVQLIDGGSLSREDNLGISVMRTSTSEIEVVFHRYDRDASIFTDLDTIALEDNHDQIALTLSRPDTANNNITASFAYVDGGNRGDITTFATTASIFNGEDFTRGQFVYLSPAPPVAVLLVSSGGTDSVVRYDGITGTFIDIFASGGGLDVPISMVFGPDGNLYVGSTDFQLGIPENNRVLRYDGTTGAFIDTFVAPYSGGLGEPDGIVFGPDGNLYVSSRQTDNNVLRYDGINGAFLGVFTDREVSAPDGLVFGPDGNLYVSSDGTNGVLRFDGTTGAFIDTFVSAGAGGLNDPERLVFGPDGNLYVSSFKSNNVLRYDGTTGAFIDIFASGGGLVGPLGLVFGPDGNLYVANESAANVLRYDGNSGAFIDIFATGGLAFPGDLVFTPILPALVNIDIKPGSDTNPINPRSKGKVPVAILTTEDFDANTVDVSTVQFGAAQPVSYALEDVDGGTDWDLVLHFNTQETGIACGDTEATLTGHTLDGVAISGADSVKTVGCKKRHHHRHHKHDDRDYDKDDQGKDHDKD